jgi:hypothetical protein
LKREGKLENFFKEQGQWLIQNSEVYDSQKQVDFINNFLRTDVKIKYTFY